MSAHFACILMMSFMQISFEVEYNVHFCLLFTLIVHFERLLADQIQLDFDANYVNFHIFRWPKKDQAQWPVK